VVYRLLPSCLNRYEAEGKGLVRTECIGLDGELQSTRNTGNLSVDA